MKSSNVLFFPQCLAFICSSAHALPSSLVLWIGGSALAQGELRTPLISLRGVGTLEHIMAAIQRQMLALCY